MKLKELNTIIEKLISEEVKKTIISENEKKTVYHVKCDGEPVETFNTEEEALGYVSKMKDKVSGKEMIIEKGVYESYSDMVDKLDEMGQQLEEKENQNMENQEPMEGNPYVKAMLDAKNKGEKTFEFEGETHDVEECWKQLEEEEAMGEWDENEEECKECGQKSMEEKLVGNQSKLDVDGDGDIEADDLSDLRSGKKSENNEEEEECKECRSSQMEEEFEEDPQTKDTIMSFYKKLHPEQMEEEKQMCSKCGGMLNEEGMCNECGTMKESTKKKKTLRLTESQMVEMIKKIVKESVPGLEVVKKSRKRSGTDSKEYMGSVEKKMKDASSFENNDNPEFPKQIGKGEKVARQNSEKEDEEVDRNFAGLQNLDYDIEPSETFKKRLKMAIEGDKLMGNSSKDVANVVPSKKAEDKLEKQIKNRKKDKDERELYKKEPVPTKTLKESKFGMSNLVQEEIEKMKRIVKYNKKTQ